jgi:hypothetical protein
MAMTALETGDLDLMQKAYDLNHYGRDVFGKMLPYGLDEIVSWGSR